MAAVCYLLKRFPRLSQTFILNEVLELERQGVDVRVVARRRGDEAVEHAGAKAFAGPVDHLPDGAGDKEIVAAVEAIAPAHLHGHFATWGARAVHLVGERTGIPYSFTAHARDIYGDHVDRAALADRIAGARFVVTVTEFNARHLERLMREDGREARIVRLYNGVDLDVLARHRGDRDGDLIVAVGRLVEKKGFAYLIDAIATVADSRPVRCAIIGDGPDRAALEARIESYDLRNRVSLLGARPSDEVSAAVARAAVFALPCVVAADGDVDALPTVILEAMALGTPVVSTAISGIPEMVQHERSGLLVPERDAATLASALERLLADAAERERFADDARAIAEERFDLRRNVGRLRALFEEAAVRA